MSIEFDQLRELLQQQQKQFEEAQLKLIESLTQKLHIQTAAVSTGESSVSSTDAAAASITEFTFDALSGHTFDSWFKRYEDMFKTDFSKFDDGWKVRLLLRKLGTPEHERFTNFILPKLPRDLSFDETVRTLSQIFGDQTSLFNIRYQCLKLAKNDDDDFITFAGVVNRECERFKLSSMTENQFKCLIFVSGLQSSRDADIRTRLLNRIEQDAEMTLQSLTTECQRLINLKHDTAMIGQSPVTSSSCVQAINYSVPRKSDKKPDRRQGKPPTSCWHCGEWHFARYCRFRRHKCSRCSRRGHKEDLCRSQRLQPPAHHRAAHKSRSNSVTATFKVDFACRRKFVTVRINDIPVRLQLDTGSDITLLSERTWKRIGKPYVKPTDHWARNASGGKLKLTGEVDCRINFKDSTAQATCYLTSCPKLDLMGLDWIEKLNLLDKPINSICNGIHAAPGQIDLPKRSLEHLLQRYASVFTDELGRCAKAKARLCLLPGAKPVFRPKRPVPYAALPIVDQELDRLQKAGVLQPTNYSAWAAPIVLVKKANGTIRLCADFSTGLNAALDTHQYPLPLPDDLFAKLNGGKCFAKIDLADAYLQVEVEEESRELLTINTHRGLFQYTRLPFGVKVAPAIFQQIMDTMLKDAPGVAAYLDDLIVMGSNPHELWQRLDYVLSRIQEYGFKVRREKCTFFMRSIKYLGFIIDEHGRRPDPENIEAIRRMPAPTDVASLRSFLGLVSHYSSFLPAMHRLRGPLNQLLTKDHKWTWSEECQRAFDSVKSMLSSDLLLTHYDPSMEIVVASDASNYGIGAVISHVFPDSSQKAIAHAARSLTSAERNYSQIEKEALAIVFAVKKFHKMLYGRQFTLLTDHKPLLAVFGSKKGIPAYTANRLQRWATLLLGYDFKIKYQSTTSLGQADALSRLIDSSRPEPEDTVIATIALEPEVNHVVSEAVRILPVTADMVRQATDQDPVLQQVIKYHRNQWPRTCQKDELRPYFNRRDALSLADGCLLFSERVVIPKKLQPAVLNQFHKGHPGTNRMKALARSYVYWPLMDSQIEQVSKSCLRCAEASKSPVKTYLSSWPQPTEPWSRLHIDYAGPVSGQHFLVVVDAYSKWPEIFPVNSPTTAITVLELRRLFSRFGTPETIVSDNGSQFTSSAFAHFCREYGITHIRSPPFHPQSNGQAERFVDTLKRALQKSRGEGPTEEILQRFLLAYRATPNPNSPDGVSPAEALLRRRLRTPHDTIRPQTKKAGHRNTRMEEQFNRHHGATARAFSEGQRVLVRDYSGRRPTWTPGLIHRRRGKVLYEIQVGPAKWIRHANQIRPTDAPIRPTGPSDMSLEMLLDTFELSTIPGSQSVASSEAQPKHELQPRRWTDRIRKPVRPMQVNPRLRSYVNKLQGGGVRQESTRIPLYRTSLGAAMAEKPSPLEVGPKFGTLAGPASRRDLIGQQSGPNSQS